MQSDPALAYRYALRLLGYRGRSERELRQRLIAKGFDEKAAGAATSKARAAGYLDDAEYARNLVREAREVRHLGARGTRRFLGGRGIDAGEAEDALAGYDDTDAARRLVRKALVKGGVGDPAERRRKLAAMLMRRGHSYETVRMIFKEDGL